MALIRRRAFLSSVALVSANVLARGSSQPGLWAQGTAPALITSDRARSSLPYSVASGDVTSDTAIIWSRTNKPSRMLVEYATTDSFSNARRVQGPAALAVSDFTARIELTDLPAGQEIFYRVLIQDLADPKILSAPTLGHFRTAPAQRRDITFVWGGDTAGQGWGINPEWGGMRIYEQMRRPQPDFFIHSGDYIYADNPIRAEVKLEDGTLWKNSTLPEKAKVAETLEEFRGNYVYNLLDGHVRRFNAEVLQVVPWDDHETTNNWFPGGIIDARNPRFKQYTVTSHDLLAAYAKRAFSEYTPIRFDSVSAIIPPGQFVAIIGRSGAGKSTLLHCLARTTTVTAGSIRFGTCDLASLHGEMLRQHRARVGMIYQQFNLVKRLRVLDNVLRGRLPHLGGRAWWLALGHYFPASHRDIALRCLDHVGLLSRAWQRTDTLSGGEQQRVAIAKVLVSTGATGDPG